MYYDNAFLEKITAMYENKEWGGIEEDYYAELKKCIKETSKVDKLNRDFDKIKQALEQYLQDKCNDKNLLNKGLKERIYSNFEKKDFTEKGINALVEDVYQDYLFNCSWRGEPTLTDQWKRKDEQDYLMAYPNERDYFDHEIKNDKMLLRPLKNILFLNFNYTKTESEYNGCEDIKTETIHIHGELNNPKNPIIFGYGDEIGKDYLEIENLNDNRFFENVKSIKYLETDNYRELLRFINSDNYQVFIMGHSCGISDRTLLSTLFEHDNCVSIKVFYHKKEDGTDNFSDVVRNISRNFSNKAVMREKVVNKKDSNPLSNE